MKCCAVVTRFIVFRVYNLCSFPSSKCVSGKAVLPTIDFCGCDCPNGALIILSVGGDISIDISKVMVLILAIFICVAEMLIQTFFSLQSLFVRASCLLMYF